MIFFLEDYCVVDNNRCEPGQIYCSEKCKDLDSQQPPSLEYSSSSTYSNESLYSNSPDFAFDEDLLQTPRCQHHFMYDSKITHHNCNCKKESTSRFSDGNLSFLELDLELNNSYELKKNKYDSFDSAKQDIIPNAMSLMGILSKEANSFDKELEENKHIKNSFKTAKDNYRLWLNNNNNSTTTTAN